MNLFPKRLRKLSIRTITDLHQKGSVIFHHPYKIFYLIRSIPTGAPSECKIVISVPKRNFKRAIARNRIKRQIREAFRLKFSVLNQELAKHGKQIDLLCLYLPHEHRPTSLLFIKMESLLQRLTQLVAPVVVTPACGIGEVLPNGDISV